jgi:UDP-N-acetylmuramoyl-L-alanyl-D-glutamate--2,6-diaminopimelate ligase
MLLKQLLKGIEYKAIGPLNLLDQEYFDIVFDSRKANQNNIFVATSGTTADGHDFIENVINQGTKVIVCERVKTENPNVIFIQVKNSKETLGLLASNYYEHPSQQLKLVGITGTNGKTTVATLLYKLFRELGYKVGLLSTVENKINDRVIASTHTTPDAISINKLLAEMRDEACDFAFMEVSSHAADQDRIAGLDFDGAIFTNISHDHLDYHHTFQNYINAKKKFFDHLSKNSFALVNIDDKRAAVMLQNSEAKSYKYSLKTIADFKARIIENSAEGLVLEIDNHEIHFRLLGEFNAYNLLAVYATATLLGEDKNEVLLKLSNLSPVEGRFDTVKSNNLDIMGIVDYAHTPDALEKILATLQKLRKAENKIITIVGCGGDRDRTKRPLMAKIACEYSDQVILTSDNPRTEKPEGILMEMENGIPASFKMKTLTISDRKQAIKTACKLAKKEDIILVAGKGHEKYQEIMGTKYPFDDKIELKQAFEDQQL